MAQKPHAHPSSKIWASHEEVSSAGFVPEAKLPEAVGERPNTFGPPRIFINPLPSTAHESHPKHDHCEHEEVCFGMLVDVEAKQAIEGSSHCSYGPKAVWNGKRKLRCVDGGAELL